MRLIFLLTSLFLFTSVFYAQDKLTTELQEPVDSIIKRVPKDRKYKLAVLPIQFKEKNTSPLSKEMATKFTQLIANHPTKGDPGRYAIIASTIINEEIGSKDKLSEQKAVLRNLGADLVLLGHLTPVDKQYRLAIELINLESNELLCSQSVELTRDRVLMAMEPSEVIISNNIPSTVNNPSKPVGEPGQQPKVKVPADCQRNETGVLVLENKTQQYLTVIIRWKSTSYFGGAPDSNISLVSGDRKTVVLRSGNYELSAYDKKGDSWASPIYMASISIEVCKISEDTIQLTK